jgi:Legionella pneumophila major outer membrane protein precursor
MRHYNRYLILLSTLVLSNSAFALQFFIEGLEWRPTETNNWAYVNNEQLPSQTLNYKTIDFNYSPGFRIGMTYTNSYDALFSYTHYDTTTHDAIVGGFIRPTFIGSVTAQPSAASLYSAAQIFQSIDFNMFDIAVGKKFNPAAAWMLHPTAGLMGGWIYQTINARYQQTALQTNETVKNNFIGAGPKAGIDTSITLFNYHDYQPKLLASFAASYLVGNWVIKDTTTVIPTRPIDVSGPTQSSGALVLQGSIGFGLDYKRFSAKLAYEMGDWFNQAQYFDNDTGSHSNDLILQGLTLGLAYDFMI